MLNNIYAFIYIDALPLEYISIGSTFLAKLMNKNVITLENIPGYSFGIQSTMLAGKLPQETKHWMPYIYVPELEQSCNLGFYRNSHFQKLLSRFRYLPGPMKYAYELSLCNPLFGTFKKGVKLCGIPVQYLRKIHTYPYYYMNENPFFLEIKRTFKEKYDVDSYYLGHSLQDALDDLVELTKGISGKKIEQDLFLFLYIDDLDGVGHMHGVGTIRWFETLKKIDISLLYLYRLFHKLAKSVHLLIFSDHGMCNADEYIDIENLFRKYNLENSIYYFVDATLTFLWLDKKYKKESILKFINKKLGDRVRVFDIEADRSALQRYGVYFGNREYGDLMIQTKLCKSFFPNFYSITRPLKGLHGFWPDEDVQQACMIFPIYYYDLDIPRHIKDIRNFLLNLIST